ncbi:MAG: hypothetical protein JXQ73_31965 [Phycisphaerae bacterium]|nr:hypothetical protein [Phycisphaerae bacterium]
MKRMVESGAWREGVVPASVAGVGRDLRILLADRKTNPIVANVTGREGTYCPPLYWDLAIGSGSCGLGCRGCYLLGTFRDRRDPMQPVVYRNSAFLWNAVRRWLGSPDRRRFHTLGLGTDRSDSLLFEGLTGHARRLIPMFAGSETNPSGCKLLLLTKTGNVHFLSGLPTRNVIVSFSLNPEGIADCWEGRWPDTGERITPPIADRLAASLAAERMGFEVRWRVDPILTPSGWEAQYEGFLRRAGEGGHRPSRITLGTFRETTRQVDSWRRRWGLPAMGWRPGELVRDGTHFHCPESVRVAVYRAVAEMCGRWLPGAVVSLCKETWAVRRGAGITSGACNCLAVGGDGCRCLFVDGSLGGV